MFCLENPRDGGAWWAAIYGVAQSRTRLPRLSSSSSLVAQLVKNLPAMQETQFNPWVRKSPLDLARKWQPPPVFLPGESHGQKSLAGYSLRGHKSWKQISELNHHHQACYKEKMS